ncbi:MAG: PDZ domain-containing protein [Planctomycetaceae bacterium]
MTAHRKRLLIRLGVTVLMVVGRGVGTSAEDVTVQESSLGDIGGFVDQLEHPDYAVRETASRRLMEAGAESIPLIADAALARPPEAATRALQVLEGHLRSDDKSRFNPADDALQRLADGERGFVAVGAANILARHSQLREERAVAAIRELGGTVTYDLDQSERQPWWGPAPLRIDAESALRGLRPSSIVLRGDWQGGTEGLKYLRRLSHCRDLKLYVVRGSGVPLVEAEKLASALPGLTVQERGALLGISGASGIDSAICVVSEVLADGPAGRAGVRDGDVIRDLNGVPVTSFDDLIEKLKEHPAGDRVKLSIDRTSFQTERRESLTLEIQLGTWDLPELSDRAQQYLKELRDIEAERRARRNSGAEESLPAETYPLFEK